MTEQFYEAPTVEQVSELVAAKFGKAVQLKGSKPRRVYMSADKGVLFELATYIHDVLNFEQASSVCAVDYESHMTVVYHLSNYFNGMMIELTVDLANDDLTVASVAPIWGGANWHERETYELFGIVFEGHPKLERLLTPADYQFFPFRRSYKLRRSD
ncbi:MAG: NADH-quinone oxidoreductase subunit C [Candidatus Methanomethylophilaceae archaeon]|nr:NADH-quinone oxidoreductase subunit C [Candidatus Methanomethylophilaceae archaeon]